MPTSLARMEATPGGHNGRPVTDQLQSPGADGIGPGWTPDPSRGQKLKCRSVVSCKPDYAYHYDHLAVQKEAMKKMPIVTVREEELLGRQQHALESRQSSRSGSSVRGGGYAGEVGATRMKEKGGKATSGAPLKRKEKTDQQRKEETSPVKVPEDEGLAREEGDGASPEQGSTVLADHEPDDRAGGQKKIPSQNRRSTLMDPTGARGAGRERRRRRVAGKLDLGGGGLAGLAKRSQNTNSSSLPRLWNPDEAESSRKSKDDGEEVGPDVMDHTPRGLGRQTRRMLSRLREAIDGDQEEKEFSNFFGKHDDEAGGAKQALMRSSAEHGPVVAQKSFNEPQKPGMGLAALGGLGSENYRSDLFREFKNDQNTGLKVGCWNRTGDFELGLGFEKLRQRTGIFKTAMQHMPGSELAELRHMHSCTVRRAKKLALPRK